MTTVAGLPVVEPRRRGTALVVPAMVALGIVLGLAVGVAPAPVGGLLLAAVLLTTLLLRLDLAVGVFVLTSLFEGYLAQVDPRATKAVAAPCSSSRQSPASTASPSCRSRRRFTPGSRCWNKRCTNGPPQNRPGCLATQWA